MKIKFEADYSKITVGQYVDFLNNEGNEIGQLSAILKIDKDLARNVSPEQGQAVLSAFMDCISTPQANHQTKWKGYGFVPNVNNISFGEWLDLDSNCKDFPKQLTKVLSILYRPITNEIGTKYNIEKYSAEHLHNEKDFRDMPLSIANGALVFFSNIENELLNRSLVYLDTTMTSEMMKAITMMEEALKQQAT